MHTVRWIRYFANKRYEVHFITSSKPSGDINNMKVHILWRFGPRARFVNYLINSVSHLIQFRRLIKNINPDIVHAHTIMDVTLLAAASGFHPLVITPWGSDVLIAPQKSIVSKWIVKYVLKRADLITCDAEHIQAPLVRFGADPKKIKLIYSGVDIQKFNPEQGDESLKKELGILGSPTIISLRRFEPIYDIESLITAAPLVLKEFPKAKFLLVGTGSQEAELRKLAKSIGVSESVKFVGWVPED